VQAGKWQIVRLLGRYRDSQDAGFRLGAFHDQLISYGTLPLSVIEWLVFDDESSLREALKYADVRSNPGWSHRTARPAITPFFGSASPCSLSRYVDTLLRYMTGRYRLSRNARLGPRNLRHPKNKRPARASGALAGRL